MLCSFFAAFRYKKRETNFKCQILLIILTALNRHILFLLSSYADGFLFWGPHKHEILNTNFHLQEQLAMSVCVCLGKVFYHEVYTDMNIAFTKSVHTILVLICCRALLLRPGIRPKPIMLAYGIYLIRYLSHEGHRKLD